MTCYRGEIVEEIIFYYVYKNYLHLFFGDFVVVRQQNQLHFRKGVKK